MIKAVFFDVGGTLIEPYPSVGIIYSDIASRHGIQRSAADLETSFRASWIKRKTLSLKQDKSWWFSILKEVFPGPVPPNLLEDIYAAFKHTSSWRVFPDVVTTLLALKAAGHRLAVVSNWDERLPDLLSGLGLSPFFEKIFVSYFVGASKPDQAIFKHGLSEMALHAKDVLHVGNDPEEDVTGATKVGMHSVLINRTGKTNSRNSLKGLDQLLPYMQSFKQPHPDR